MVMWTSVERPFQRTGEVVACAAEGINTLKAAQGRGTLFVTPPGPTGRQPSRLLLKLLQRSAGGWFQGGGMAADSHIHTLPEMAQSSARRLGGTAATAGPTWGETHAPHRQCGLHCCQRHTRAMTAITERDSEHIVLPCGSTLDTQRGSDVFSLRVMPTAALITSCRRHP
jgi:hypothetical protein